MSQSFLVPEDLQARYLRRRVNDLNVLKESLSRGSLTYFTRIGHQIKGNASSFGFDDLEPLAQAMENCGQNEDRAAAHLVVATFSNWLATQFKFEASLRRR